MTMMTLDASVAVKWIANEPGSEQARRYITALSSARQDDKFIAPAILLLELHHALSKKFIRKEVNFAQISSSSTYIGLFCTIHPVNAEFAKEAGLLSLLADSQLEGHKLQTDLRHFAAEGKGRPYKPFSIYDCAYVLLARDTGSVLLTADQAQAEVATAFNIAVEFVSAE